MKITDFTKLSEEWNYEKNEGLDPENVNSSKRGCPYCANQKVCGDNCLSKTHSEIAKQWHPTKNENLTPENVTAGSGRMVWWKCEKEHEWQAVIGTRTLDKTGCPYCHKSKGEEKISKILNKNKIKFKEQYKFKTCKNKRCLLFDFVIWINRKIVCIEYNGKQHYEHIPFDGKYNSKEIFEDIVKRDNIKKEWCESKNIPLLIIPYWDFDNIENIILELKKRETNR